MTRADGHPPADPRPLLTDDRVVAQFSGRKFRLLAAAFVRTAAMSIPVPTVIDGLTRAEAAADVDPDDDQSEIVAAAVALRTLAGTSLGGWRPFEQLTKALCEAVGPSFDAVRPDADYFAPQRASWQAVETARLAALAEAAAAAGPAPRHLAPGGPWHATFNRAWAAATALQADLVRCVLGEPNVPTDAEAASHRWPPFRTSWTTTPSTTAVTAYPFDPAWRSSIAVAMAEAAYASGEFHTLPILADAIQEAGCSDDRLLAHCRAATPHVRGCWVIDAILGKV